jgi:hypothetical protein
MSATSSAFEIGPSPVAIEQPIATASLRFRRFLQRLMGQPRKPPVGDGPDEDQTMIETILNDPLFWMYLNH